MNRENVQEENTKKDEFQFLLNEWSKLSKQVLSSIHEKDPSIIDELKPNQAMALGALEAHLSLSVQAQSAVYRDG